MLKHQHLSLNEHNEVSELKKKNNHWPQYVLSAKFHHMFNHLLILKIYLFSP